jgi:predicted NBD/HSP70 family sugar kinase
MALDQIRAARSISRVELAEGLGLTSAAVTRIVRDLLDDGLVVEDGRGRSTGGKPRTILRLNVRSRYSIGVHLERNACVIVVIDLAGGVVTRAVLPGVASAPPGEILSSLADRIHVRLRSAGIELSTVVGLGLVTYGPQDWRSGVLLTPQPNPQWLDFPVAERMSEFVRLPVLVDNDANAAAIGEYWLGGVEPSSTFASLYLGTGIGGGVVVAGQLYRGSSSNGVEIGHISIDVNGESCSCGNRGCLERMAGPEAVVRHAWQTPLADRLALGPSVPATEYADFLDLFARITDAAVAGDTEAQALVEESARLLGHASITLANLFDLDTIVLAGPGFGSAAATYREVIAAEVNRSWFSRRAHAVRVVPSVSGSDAAAIGAAALVLQHGLVDRPIHPVPRRTAV